MILEAMDAIRNALREIFPREEVPRLYINDVPESFKRPALYLQKMPGTVQPMTTHISGYPSAWQVIYFPVLGGDNLHDEMSLYSITDRMTALFGRVRTLEAPEGRIFRVEQYGYSLREGNAYFTIQLWAALREDEPYHEPMDKVTLTMKLKDLREE